MLTQMLDEASAAMTTQRQNTSKQHGSQQENGCSTKNDDGLTRMARRWGGFQFKMCACQYCGYMQFLFVAACIQPANHPSSHPSIHPRQPHIQTKCKKLTMQRFVVVRLCLFFVSETHIHMCMSSICEGIYVRKKKTLYKNSKYIVY